VIGCDVVKAAHAYCGSAAAEAAFLYHPTDTKGLIGSLRFHTDKAMKSYPVAWSATMCADSPREQNHRRYVKKEHEAEVML
jgi:hypothetical protein